MSAPESGYDFPWERGAMQGAEMPDGLSIYDQMAYISLRTLYHDYHEKRLGMATSTVPQLPILTMVPHWYFSGWIAARFMTGVSSTASPTLKSCIALFPPLPS